ncbi:hypothetical protein HHI36_018340 [Cryptolaemus montrouzieri]|uniref:Uncharacterized protein n=1 Tax=Cryptolaemus montrouzieri TaxID=559131 RepID=A0ABD2NZV0_9CUCU
MAETTSSSKSRVLEDIINLEQDFKYNLNLLKIRDIEIEKCNIVNQNLQAKLNRVVAETKELNKKYIQLQHEFEALQQERKEDRKVIETKLSLEDNERRQSHRKIQQIFGNNFSQKSNILQIISEMRIAEQKYKETITTYKTQIGDQTKHLDNLQKKYTNIMEENITLSNKIKDINARKISEICMYKYELEKVLMRLNCSKRNNFNPGRL